MATLNALFQDGPLRVDPKKKITISFSPLGSLEALAQPKIKVSADRPFGDLVRHVKKTLKLGPDEALYLLAQQTFQPDDDTLLHDINLLCGINNVITLHYSKQA